MYHSHPAAGGPVARELNPEQRELDHEARHTINRELGHEREAVEMCFLLDQSNGDIWAGGA
jgi:hypothetical protein